MSNTIDNLLNGNISDAKKLAKSQGWEKLYKAARDEYGMTEKKARALADFLTGKGTFAAYASSA